MAEEKTFLWNDAGMIISGLKHYQDGSVDTISFEYNETGNLIKRTIITDEDEVEQVETFEWENGELISHEIFDEHGDPVEIQEAPAAKSSQTRITQNEKGQVVTEEELDENEEVFMTIRRMYDDDGQPEEVEVFIDGRGQAISRHYFLKYEYTFFE
jgi:hypothetical protein